MSQRPAVFAYDISDPRLRRRALRALREWRLDGQLSVHECLLGAHDARRLFAQLRQELDPLTDQLLFAWVQQQRPILAVGQGRTGHGDGGLLLAA
jgi:CRISPR-associated protein Cas2